MRLANSTIRRAAILGTTTSTGPHQSSSANTSTKNEVASLCCGRKVYGDMQQSLQRIQTELKRNDSYMIVELLPTNFQLKKMTQYLLELLSIDIALIGAVGFHQNL